MAEVNTYNDFSVAANETTPLISNFSFMLKPQVGADLFDVNPLETDIGEMMKMGLMKEVKGEEIIHHEANKRFDVPFINTSATLASVYGTASTGNGDPAAFDSYDYIQLAAASHSPTSGANANKFSYPRVGNLVQFKNGGVWRINGKREDVAGAHRLYIKKVNASVPALSATITQVGSTYGGDAFIVFSYVFEEATSGMQKGLVPTSKTYTNYLQTFYDFYDVTDQAENNETYPLKFGGQTINFVYEKGISDTEIRFGMMEDHGLFLTPKDDGTLTGPDENGNTVTYTTTQGYMPNLELNAQKLYYDTNPTIALFKQISRLRRKQHQGRECMIQYGSEWGLSVEDIVTQLLVNGGTTYNRSDVDLNIRQIQLGNFVFKMKEMKIFNHPDFLGAPGFKYPEMFVVAPMDKTKDAKTNIMRDAFCIMYKKQIGRGARGHYKIWDTGANTQSGTDGKLIRRIHLASRKGMQVVGASRFILGKPIQ